MKRHELYIEGKYRNLKNRKLYRIVGFALHSETMEHMVLYHPEAEPGIVLDSGDGVQFPWARPTSLFLEKFEPSDPECQNPQCLNRTKEGRLYCSEDCAEMSCTDRGFPPLEVMDEIKNTPAYERKAKKEEDPDDFVDDWEYDYMYDEQF